MQYTAGQAAKAAGVATSTITNALKAGKISGSKDANGAWRIDPAELHRVFPAKARSQAANERGAIPAETMGLERVVALLEAQVEDLRAERDRWRAEADHWRTTRLLAPAPAPEGGVAVDSAAERAPPAAQPPTWRNWIAQIFGAR